MGVSHAPTTRGRDPSATQFWGAFYRRTTKFDTVTHMGLFLAGLQRSPIWGSSCIYAHTLKRRTTKFGMVTHWGGVCF